MKICYTEAIKLIKQLESEKENLIQYEDSYCRISYKEGENKIASDYNYNAMRNDIEALDLRIRTLRYKLAIANCSTIIDDFDISISEGLIMLAQLQNEKAQVESLAEKKQLSRCVTYNGAVEYTECSYDVNTAKADVKIIRDKIAKLQVAIDRANLTNYIEA